MIESKISKIRKRSGRIVDWDQGKITNAIYKALVSVGQDESMAEELSDKVVKVLNKRFGERVPGVEQIQDVVEEVLKKEKLDKVARHYHLYRKKRSEIRKAKWWLVNYEVKTKLSPNALKVLEARYLKKNEAGKIVETPQDLFKRVAQNIASSEKIYHSHLSEEELFRIEEKFYRMMASLSFLPNSPTLMNAGNVLQQLSACFVLPVGDSIEEIFEAVKDTALIHQSGGGTGFDFSRLRPRGDIVKSTKGIASGPVSFMRVFDAATDTIKQGGKRRGANMGILRVDHPDILEFINAKHKEGILSNFNISVAVTDEFMEKVKKKEDYDLVNPRTGQVWGQLNAKRVFDLIVHYAWETGDPGVIFIDRINEDNPTPQLGDIESTNPCVTGDTLVSTEKGLVRIQDIASHHSKGGLEILCDEAVLGQIPPSSNPGDLDSLRDCNLHQISKAFKTGKKLCYKMITESGYELEATQDHKIMTTKGWKQLQDIKEGQDKVLIQPQKGRFNENDDLPFEVKNEIQGKNGREYHLNLPKNWSPKLGECLGWLIGDGWLKEGKDCRIGFTFGRKDKGILNYFKEILDSYYGKSIKVQQRENEVYHLSYHSKFFVDFFKKLGVQPWNSGEKRVPSSIYTAPKNAVGGFLRGLFGADGTVLWDRDHKMRYARLNSKSLNLLKDVQKILLNLGIKSKIYDRSRGAPKGLFPYQNQKGEIKTYNTEGILFELNISRDSLKKFVKEVGFLKGEKKEVAQKMKELNYYQDRFEEKVVEIKEIGKREVYDLTEPHTHSFIANGFIISNCGEQPLLPYESCNLGSINLNKVVKGEIGKGKIDWDKLKEIVHNAVRFLDNVIDANRYPLVEIEEMTRGNRKIGLGVMGFADMLIRLGIRYNSRKALKTAEKVMKFINQESQNASQNLAQKRGVFPNYEKSIFDKKGGFKLRNATTTTIAPTGTIGIIANCSSGIEPLFSISFVRKHVLGGRELIQVNPVFEEIAKKRGFYSKKLIKKISGKPSIQDIEEIPKDVRNLFVTTFDIDPEWHVKMQAAFQKHVDNSVSKTINFPYEASEQEVREAYLLAHKLGCKGITIFRTGSRRQQVLNIQEEEESESPPEKIPEKEAPPGLRNPSPELPDVPPGSCPSCNI